MNVRTNATRTNAVPCPYCGAYATPAADTHCWRCGGSFLGDDFWDYLNQ